MPKIKKSKFANLAGFEMFFTTYLDIVFDYLKESIDIGLASKDFTPLEQVDYDYLKLSLIMTFQKLYKAQKNI